MRHLQYDDNQVVEHCPDCSDRRQKRTAFDRKVYGKANLKSEFEWLKNNLESEDRNITPYKRTFH